MTTSLESPTAAAVDPARFGPPRKQQSVRARIRSHLPGFVSLVAFLGIWQAAISLTDPNPLILPDPRSVFDALVTAVQAGEVWAAVQASAGPLGIGMLFSLLAIPVGLLIGLSPTIDMLTSPYLWGFFALPNVAFAPLLILMTGFSTTTSIWMVFLSAAVPLCLSCKDGVQSVDRGLVRAARSFGGGPIAVFVKVIAPCSMPFIASGVRNAISRGFVGLLSVELLIGAKGIGGEVIQSARVYDTARMIAFILLLIAIALMLVSASRRLEIFASRWREEVVI